MIEGWLFAKRFRIDHHELASAGHSFAVPELAGLVDPVGSLHNVDSQPLILPTKVRGSSIVGLHSLCSCTTRQQGECSHLDQENKEKAHGSSQRAMDAFHGDLFRMRVLDPEGAATEASHHLSSGGGRIPFVRRGGGISHWYLSAARVPSQNPGRP